MTWKVSKKIKIDIVNQVKNDFEKAKSPEALMDAKLNSKTYLQKPFLVRIRLQSLQKVLIWHPKNFSSLKMSIKTQNMMLTSNSLKKLETVWTFAYSKKRWKTKFVHFI